MNDPLDAGPVGLFWHKVKIIHTGNVINVIEWYRIFYRKKYMMKLN